MKTLLLLIGISVLVPLSGECRTLTDSLRTPYGVLTNYFYVRTYITRSGIVIVDPTQAKMDAILADAHAQEFVLSNLYTIPQAQKSIPSTGQAGVRYGSYPRVSPERAF